MEMKILDYFLSGHYPRSIIDFSYKSEEGNVRVNDQLERFFSIRALIHLKEDDLTLRSFVNNEFLFFNKDTVDFLCSLYTELLLPRIFKLLVAEFLYSYHNSIDSSIYKISVEKSDYSYFYSKFERKSFYNNGTISQDTQEFYKEIVDFYEKNELFASSTVLRLLLKNIVSSDLKSKLVSILLQKQANTILAYQYDNSKSENISRYTQYIENNLENERGLDNLTEIASMMLKDGLLEFKTLTLIINAIINSVNFLAANIRSRDTNLTLTIHNIDSLLVQVNTILAAKLNGFDECREKLFEVRRSILYLKRKLLSDEDAIHDSLTSIAYNIQIDKNLQDKVSLLIDNLDMLYSSIGIDFSKSLIDSITLYSSYPLQHIISRYSLDTNQQMYNNIEPLKTNPISEYYELLGQVYIERNQQNLMNVPRGDFYSLLINYQNSYYLPTVSIISDIMLRTFPSIMDKIRNELFLNKDLNEYVTILIIHIQIEGILLELESSSDLNDPVNSLFRIFSKETEPNLKNGLTYIYYCLFEPGGLRLRDNYAHGNAFTSKSTFIDLLISLAAYFFIQYYRSKRYIDEKDVDQS
jgi:hypothetical protein